MRTSKKSLKVKKPEEKIYKTFSSELKVSDDNKRTLTVTISTPNEDRSHDTMNMKGMQYDNFIKNPVVLFAHNYASKPIAKCTSLQITDKAAVATVEFTPKGLYDEADVIYEMYKQGFLSAWSIGFRPIDYDYNDKGGYAFNSWELFEFSSVPVPDNPEALTIMRSKGINVDVLLGKKAEEEEENTEEEDIEEEEEEHTKEVSEQEEATEEKTISEEAKETEQPEEVVKTDEGETKDLPEGDADNPKDPGYTEDTKVTDLTVGQLIDVIDRVLDQEEAEESEEGKSAGKVVKKDVSEVLALANVLDCLSWFIWMFENNEVNQADIDKLNQALGLVLQVVQNQAELGKKAFNLAEFPTTKESVKILAKAGRTISGKHEEMLTSASDHADQIKSILATVLSSVTEEHAPSQDEDDLFNSDTVVPANDDDEKAFDLEEDFLLKLANSLKTNNQQTAAVAKKQNEALNQLDEIYSLLKGGEK